MNKSGSDLVSGASCYVTNEMFLFNIYFSNSRNHNDLKFFKLQQNALQQARKRRKRNSVTVGFGWLTVACSGVKCIGYTCKSSQLHWARKWSSLFICSISAAEAVAMSQLRSTLVDYLYPLAAAVDLFATFILAFLILVPQRNQIKFVTSPDCAIWEKMPHLSLLSPILWFVKDLVKL